MQSASHSSACSQRAKATSHSFVIAIEHMLIRSTIGKNRQTAVKLDWKLVEVASVLAACITQREYTDDTKLLQRRRRRVLTAKVISAIPLKNICSRLKKRNPE